MHETTDWARGLHSIAPFALTIMLTIMVGLPGGGPPSYLASAPPFAGTAAPLLPATTCPRIVPRGLGNPFSNGGHPTRRITVADYRLVGCWVGAVGAKRFVYDEFASPQGAGLAVAYGGTLVAHVSAGGGPPVVVRFTATAACWAEQAGAYSFAVDLETGRVQSSPWIQRVCAPPRWPPCFVRGVPGRRYPFGIELRRSGHTAAPRGTRRGTRVEQATGGYCSKDKD